MFDQVFVVRYETPEVEMYDSNTLNLTSRLPVDGLAYPYGGPDIVQHVPMSLYLALGWWMDTPRGVGRSDDMMEGE